MQVSGLRLLAVFCRFLHELDLDSTWRVTGRLQLSEFSMMRQTVEFSCWAWECRAAIDNSRICRGGDVLSEYSFRGVLGAVVGFVAPL